MNIRSPQLFFICKKFNFVSLILSSISAAMFVESWANAVGSMSAVM
jgi:hypothetical protein